MKEAYKIKSSPTLCGSISGSIGGLGVIMHNAAYEFLDLDYTYVSFQPSSLEGAIGSIKNLGIRGMGVTRPY
jgi:shikimate dehydrogenase